MKAKTGQIKTVKNLIAAEVNIEHNYYVYGSNNRVIAIFNFKPRQRYTFCDEYPGDPKTFKIHKKLFNELKALRILKGVYKNG